jgi:hypothetical protein
VYAITGGRTRSNGSELAVEALVTATDLAMRQGSGLQIEYRSILEVVTRAISVVEIGALLRVPVGVARVLVSDLANAGYLVVHAPPPVQADGGPGQEILGRLLHGLRAR